MLSPHTAPSKGSVQRSVDVNESYVVAEDRIFSSRKILRSKDTPSDFSTKTEKHLLLTEFISFSRSLTKRLIDVTASFLFLLFMFPLFVIIACLVSVDGGPIIYKSVRVGRHGREFRCLKFRTMMPDSENLLAELLRASETARAEWDLTCKLKHDPRVTRIGRLLRTLSIDELPQLLNILAGSMSLVGPRPVPQAELQKYYGIYAQDYLRVRPGLTGPWQVGGRSDASYARRVAFDVEYARNPSIRTDLRTLLQTVSAVLFCRGAR